MTPSRRGRAVLGAFPVVALLGLGWVWGQAAWELGGLLRLIVGVVAPVAAVLVTGARRQRDPVPVVVALGLGAVVVSWASGTDAWRVLGPAALFMVEAYEPRERVRHGVLAAGVAALAAAALPSREDWVAWAIEVVVLVGVIGWGRSIRLRRLYQASLRQRAEDAERERDLRAAQAVAEERTRIARDIHDIVSHSLAVVAVQASGAQRIAHRDPARAEEALGVIAATARGALTEMRSLLQVLRSPDPASTESQPTPGLTEIEVLVAGMAARGLPVDQRVLGTPFGLPAGAELAVHRMVQEALTNALKHGAPGGPVALTLDYRTDALEVVVTNPLRAASTSFEEVPGSGSGLLGMRERLALYGGTLTAGVVHDRFEVRATLPRPEPTTPTGASTADASAGDRTTTGPRGAGSPAAQQEAPS